MVKLETLGACGEVGRSAFLITDSNDDQFLLDYGISMKKDNRLPIDVEPRKIKAVAASHAHVDHTGALPYLYISSTPRCFMTKPTRTISKVLLDDMLRISGPTLPFEKPELRNFLKHIHILKHFNKPVDVPHMPSTRVTIFDAGHIPGSAMFLLNVEGKNILYTGDMNTLDTRLLWGARTNGIPELDALIIESTYAAKNHPPRLETEKHLVTSIKDVLKKKGKVLIPAFGVARSQEVLSILQTYGFNNRNIVVDGMAREVSRLLLRNSDYLRTVYSLDRVKLVKQVRSRSDRRLALQNGEIIVAPSGMLKGGTVRYYARNIIDKDENGVFLVSYQVEGTPGRTLLEEQKYFLDKMDELRSRRDRFTKGAELDVRAEVAQFDLSSHSDGPELLKFVQSLKFKDSDADPRVFCVHGDRDNCDFLAKIINENIEGIDAIAPDAGEEFTI